MAERTLMPTRKVWAGGAANAAAFLVVSVGNRYGMDITAEEALAFSTLFSTVIAYVIPNKIVTQVGEAAGQNPSV